MAPLLRRPGAGLGHTSLAEIDTATRYVLAHRPDQPATDAPALFMRVTDLPGE